MVLHRLGRPAAFQCDNLVIWCVSQPPGHAGPAVPTLPELQPPDVALVRLLSGVTGRHGGWRVGRRHAESGRYGREMIRRRGCDGCHGSTAARLDRVHLLQDVQLYFTRNLSYFTFSYSSRILCIMVLFWKNASNSYCSSIVLTKSRANHH